MAAQDETIQGMAQDVESQAKQKSILRPIQDTPNIFKMLLFAALAGYVIFSDKINLPQTTRIIIVVVAAAAFFWVSQAPTSLGEIPEEKIISIAYSRLVFYQKHYFGATTRIPQGKIIMDTVGVPQYESWDSEIIKWWNHKFIVKAQDNTSSFEGIIRTNPYTGMMRGLLELKQGFTGFEEPERIFVGKEDLAKSAWARRELNKFPPSFD